MTIGRITQLTDNASPRIRTRGPELHDMIEQLTKQLTAANVARNLLLRQVENRDGIISELRAEIERLQGNQETK
jgi:hypothetical protein